jgi:hypothetical protein
MARRTRKSGATENGSGKVYGFRLDDAAAEQRLSDLANRFATTPSKYAKAVLTSHLVGEPKATPADGAASGFDELQLGTFLRQVRHELLAEAERQGKRLDASTARMNVFASKMEALAARVEQVHHLLADFLARTEPL